MNNLHIQKVSINQVEALQHISKQTFTETFGADNSEANMKAYLEKGFSLETLKKEVANKDSEFYFAVLDDALTGYLKINFGHTQTEIQDENSLEIERIYVLKEFHGQQVGQKLYVKAMEVARQKKVGYVWLGVWEKNPRAIRFYEKNGFEAFDKHVFNLGNDQQTDIMMKLEIK